jgi:hypothetical protein
MSNLLQLPDVSQVDSRLYINSQKKVVIRRGATNTNIQRQTASSYSNNQIVYNTILNGAHNTVVDPYMYTSTTFDVVIGATGLGTELIEDYLQQNFSLRCLPMNSITSVAAVQINNQTTSSYPSQLAHPLVWMQSLYDGDGEALGQSIAPIMPDTSQDYDDVHGSLLNPLASYQIGGSVAGQTRGSFNESFETVFSGTGTWHFTVTLNEPILNPVLEYTPLKEREGLAYLKILNITLTLTANINRIFSLNSTLCPNISSITCNITGSTLVMSWLSIPNNMKLPQVALRSFNTMVSNQTNQLVAPVGSGMKMYQSQAYNINQIPNLIYVFLQDSNLDIATGYQKTDTFFSIQQCTVTFNNKNGILSTFLAADLYNAAMAEQSCKISFVQSQYFVGSVLALDPVKLFGLEPQDSAGVLGTYYLQIQIGATNIANVDIIPNMWVIFALDTYLTTEYEGQTNLIQGLINQEQVLASAELPAVPFKFGDSNDIYGGRVFDKIKSFANKAFNFAKNHKLASKGLSLLGTIQPEFAPITGPLSAYAESRGYGRGRTSKRELMARQRAMQALSY